MGSLNSGDLLKVGWKLEEEYEKLIEAKQANRDLLRLMQSNDGLNEKEEAELVELYPPRKRTPKDDQVEDAEGVE
jgi:hypothetical protein